MIDLAKAEDVGIYPETKHPTYFDSIGLSLEEPLVRVLRANGLDRRSADVFVQSFEVSNLQELSRELRVPLVQLTSATGRPYDFTADGDPRTYADLTTPSGLRWVARYADGLGPDKNQIVPRDSANRLLAPTSLVADAHRAGLQVHPYTFRPENNFLSADHRAGNPASPRRSTCAHAATSRPSSSSSTSWASTACSPTTPTPRSRCAARCSAAERGVRGRQTPGFYSCRPLARLRTMPSSTLATVSHASTADSSVSKMSFQRITIIGSMPATNRSGDRGALDPVGLVLEPVDLDQLRADVEPVAQPAQARGDLLGGGHEHLGHRLRLLHRRLDGVERELVGGLLGEVDDVVERAGQRVHVGGVEVRAAAAALGQPVQDVVDDPVALLLAQQDVAREPGLLGEVREQVAQQQRGALDVAPGLLEERQQFGVGPGPAQRHA